MSTDQIFGEHDRTFEERTRMYQEKGGQPETVEKSLVREALSGGSSNHYKVHIQYPRTFSTPYDAECEDIITALDMNFAEGEAFKAIWRSAAARLGNGKAGNKALYDAEKVVHFGNSMVLIASLFPSQHIKDFQK